MFAFAMRAVPALLGAACVVALVQCSGDASHSDDVGNRGASARQLDGAHYVGSQKCAECHADEYQLWQGSHHQLAMQDATEQTVLGNFDDATLEHYGSEAHFRQRDGSFWVVTEGSDGEQAEFQVSAVFGVDPLQQYLVEMPGGRMQVLPFCWDSRPEAQGGQRWYHLYAHEAIPPGDLLHWTGREQNWNSMCAECHSTGLQRNYDPEQDVFETRWQEQNVACEACHGPGAQHVAWTESGDTKSTSSGPAGLLVDLADRSGGQWQAFDGGVARQRSAPPSPDQALQSCAPCHSRRRALVDGDPAGGHLLDSHQLELIREPLYFADGQIRDEVYVHGSFLQSKMHAAGVRCNDCHDPHSLQLRAPGNALCLQCHDAPQYNTPDHHFHAADGSSASCVDCHMPTRTYMGVDVRHDHSFRVPRPDLSPITGAPHACSSCHDDRSDSWAEAAITAARDGDASWRKPHFGPTFAAAAAGIPGAEQALAALVMDTTQAGIVRASALAMLQQAPQRLRLPLASQLLDDPNPLLRHEAVSAIHDLPVATREQILGLSLNDPVRAVRIAAARRLIELREDHPFSEQTSLDQLLRAREELNESYGASAERPETWLNRALDQLAADDLAGAEASYQHALRQEPRFAAAAINLADLYRATQRDAAGKKVLEDLLAELPDSADGHHAYGLLLVRAGDKEKALEHLEKAARYAPDNPRNSFVYAVALQDQGKLNIAATVLEELLARMPFEADARSLLASIYLQADMRADAQRHIEQFEQLHPDDPRARGLRQALDG